MNMKLSAFYRYTYAVQQMSYVNTERFQIARSAEHPENWRIVSPKSIMVSVCVLRHLYIRIRGFSFFQ